MKPQLTLHLLCNEVDKTTKNLPDYVKIDYKIYGMNKLSKDYFEIDCDGYEYTYGHIFKKTSLKKTLLVSHSQLKNQPI